MGAIFPAAKMKAVMEVVMKAMMEAMGTVMIAWIIFRKKNLINFLHLYWEIRAAPMCIQNMNAVCIFVFKLLAARFNEETDQIRCHFRIHTSERGIVSGS